MPAFIVTDVQFDLSDSLESDFIGDNGETITDKELHKRLQKTTIGKVIIADQADECADIISDETGWCVTSSKVKEIPSVKVSLYGLFGGETNDIYRRFTVPILGKTTDLAIIRKVKSELGWCGIKCAILDYGCSIELEPKGLLQKAVIEVNYPQ